MSFGPPPNGPAHPYGSPSPQGSPVAPGTPTPAGVSLLGRIVYVASLPLALLLPCWASFGRLILGVGGWLTIMMMMFVLPVAVLVLGAGAIVLLVRRRATMSAGPGTCIAAISTWVGWFLLPMCFGDAGDSASDAVDAPLTRWFGISGGLLNGFALLVAAIAVVGAIVTLVLAAGEPRDRPAGPRPIA